jgi:hypothetical protein
MRNKHFARGVRMFCFKLSLSLEAFCIFCWKVLLFRATCVSWQWNHVITELGCVLSRPRKLIFWVLASGSPFKILMISLPFEGDFEHFLFPRRPGAGRSQKHARKLWKRNGATTELRYEIWSISLQASAFFNAKSAGRSKHFNIYNESKHFVRSMLNFRCEISISLEAFACCASKQASRSKRARGICIFQCKISRPLEVWQSLRWKWHFARSMLNSRCDISISLEAFACSASK